MLFCLQVFDGEECPHLVLPSQDPAERNQGGEVEEGEGRHPGEGHGNGDLPSGQGDPGKVWQRAFVGQTWNGDYFFGNVRLFRRTSYFAIFVFTMIHFQGTTFC